MTSAVAAFGTLLKIGDGATPVEAFTTIAEVKGISGPSLSAETADVTTHSSANYWREFLSTVLDPGEVSFSVNFIPTGATHRDAAGGLLNDMKNRTKRNFKVVFSDTGATTWSFSGFVTEFEPEADLEEALQADVTIKLTGAPTLA